MNEKYFMFKEILNQYKKKTLSKIGERTVKIKVKNMILYEENQEFIFSFKNKTIKTNSIEKLIENFIDTFLTKEKISKNTSKIIRNLSEDRACFILNHILDLEWKINETDAKILNFKNAKGAVLYKSTINNKETVNHLLTLRKKNLYTAINSNF